LLHVEALVIDQAGRAAASCRGSVRRRTDRRGVVSHLQRGAAAERRHVQDLDGDDRTGCRRTDRRGQFLRTVQRRHVEDLPARR
jgi:hypothetical protein